MRSLALLVACLALVGCLQVKPASENTSAQAQVLSPHPTAVVSLEPDEFAFERERMVREQLTARDIRDERVLQAMRLVKRHEFVPNELRTRAYEDNPLPIGEGQTISQPYIVALMTQALELNGSERVLEIGTGSGYQAAVLAHTAKEAYSIEIRLALAERANETLKRLDYKNVFVKQGDGYFGWQERAPFDAVMVTAAVDHVPPPLLKQLKDGGKLVLPLGSVFYYQTLTLVKKSKNAVSSQYITDVRFVPLVGEGVEKAKAG